MIDATVFARREAILEAARRHGAGNVRVFGSAAKGDVGEASDVDFLVELEPGRSLVDHASLMLDLQKILGRPVDVVEPAGLHAFIKDKILAEATPL
jgi:hypothetical protein